MSEGAVLLTPEAFNAVLDALTERLLADIHPPNTDNLRGSDPIALIGVYTGGAHLAMRIADRIAARTGRRPPLGTMDITLYRDDLYTGLEKPILGETDIPFNVTGQRIVLVDDVLFTGRTVHAALRQLMDYGRPQSVTLLVLIDRGHRELPIAADYIGQTVETTKRDKIVVRLREDGSQQDGVDLIPDSSAG